MSAITHAPEVVGVAWFLPGRCLLNEYFCLRLGFIRRRRGRCRCRFHELLPAIRCFGQITLPRGNLNHVFAVPRWRSASHPGDGRPFSKYRIQSGAGLLDRVADGAKPWLVRWLGATYHTSAIDRLGVRPTVVLECTGVSQLTFGAIEHAAPGPIVCLIGLPDGRCAPADMAALVRILVRGNGVMFGSVNAGDATSWPVPTPCPAPTQAGWPP